MDEPSWILSRQVKDAVNEIGLAPRQGVANSAAYVDAAVDPLGLNPADVRISRYIA